MPRAQPRRAAPAFLPWRSPPAPRASRTSRPQGPNLRAEIITVQPSPPNAAVANQCWDSDTIPAVIETVTEQSLVSPEVRDAAGKMVKPAVWRSVSKLHMVQESSEVWFRVPCPAVETADFWASVQRALKARGYYLQQVTGQNDAATAEAVRRYQAGHGLDSPILSLAAAQDLGLVAVPLDQLH